MDSLDPKTLHKLYEYVRSSVKQRQPPQKKVKAQYSQEDASKKITELEQTLQKLPRAPHGKGECFPLPVLLVLIALYSGHHPYFGFVCLLLSCRLVTIHSVGDFVRQAEVLHDAVLSSSSDSSSDSDSGDSGSESD